MKKIVLMAILFAGISSTVNVNAQDTIKVVLNGEKLEFDQNPIAESGYTLVPMRTIFEKLGAEVQWEAENATVVAKQDSKEIKLKIDNKNAQVNGKTFVLDTPARAVNGRTLVPLRFISEQLGVKVEWDGETRTVILTNEYKNFDEFENVPDFGEYIDVDRADRQVNEDKSISYMYKNEDFNEEGIKEIISYCEFLEKNGYKYDGFYENKEMNGKIHKYTNGTNTVEIGTKGSEFVITVR